VRVSERWVQSYASRFNKYDVGLYCVMVGDLEGFLRY